MKLKLEDYDWLCTEQECPIHPCINHLKQQKLKNEFKICVSNKKNF